MQSTGRRIHAIDGIRGFSLFGILLANLLIFQYGMWGKDEIQFFELSKLDEFMYAFTKIAVEGSFMPIFTFLFGYSLIMMKNSLERKGLKVKRHFFRRSLMLIFIGYLHATYLWEGDILLLYGVMGILLLLFINRKPKTVLIWGLILFAFFACSFFIGGNGDNDFLANIDMKPYVEKSTRINSTGTYLEIKNYRNNGEDPLTNLAEEKLALILLLMPLTIAPLFLFGMYAAKREIFFQPAQEKKMYWIGFLLFTPIGLTLKISGFIFSKNIWTDGLTSIGGPILALGYIFLIALFYSREKSFAGLNMLESVGKLSLTNYIMQTVICTTIFYGYGLGLFARLGVFGGFVLGIVVFGLQIIYSTIYLKYFRYGPLEKITRIWTYLSFSVPGKKKRADNVA